MQRAVHAPRGTLAIRFLRGSERLCAVNLDEAVEPSIEMRDTLEIRAYDLARGEAACGETARQLGERQPWKIIGIHHRMPAVLLVARAATCRGSLRIAMGWRARARDIRARAGCPGGQANRRDAGGGGCLRCRSAARARALRTAARSRRRDDAGATPPHATGCCRSPDRERWLAAGFRACDSRLSVPGKAQAA